MNGRAAIIRSFGKTRNIPQARNVSASASNLGAERMALAARGFSLVEIVAVVVILGIISAMAAPRYAQFVGRQRIEAAARRVALDIALAQRQAKLTGAARSIIFDAVADSYQLPGVTDLDHPSLTYGVQLSAEPYRANIVSATFGAYSTLIFDAFGAPDSDGNVIIAVGAARRTVSVSAETGGTSIIVGIPGPLGGQGGGAQ